MSSPDMFCTSALTLEVMLSWWQYKAMRSRFLMASLAVVMPLTPGYSSMVVSTVWALAVGKQRKLTLAPDFNAMVVINEHIIRIQLIISLVHEDCHTDLPHTIIHQVRGINKLIFIHLLPRSAAEGLHCHIHTLGKVG
ncbi:hypothetical protein E2C01_006602 [Portunus trituberculatus]|uniref:Uncharacterized protein n=1 Tax=Portunus trituberculatus TaxID=210409 RepID=A0A5B7D289_PORTR|nr:hypothetical protein [Portunus trituberculatus]